MLPAMYGHTVQTNLDIEHTSVGHAHARPTSRSIQIFSSTNGTMQRLTFDVTVDDLQFVVQKVDCVKELVGIVMDLFHREGATPEDVILETRWNEEGGGRREGERGRKETKIN